MPTTPAKPPVEKRPMTYDHLKSLKKPSVRRVSIIMSSETAETMENSQTEVQYAEFKIMQEDTPENQKELSEKKAKLEAAREAAKEDSIEFVFKAVGRKPYDALVDAHPVTEEQRKEAVEQGGEDAALQWNPETFPPALIAASIIAPPLSTEEVQELWDSEDWAFSELQTLFFTALAANQARRVVDLGNV